MSKNEENASEKLIEIINMLPKQERITLFEELFRKYCLICYRDNFGPWKICGLCRLKGVV